VAGITNETAKTVEIPLHFLEKNKTYQCTYYLDAPDAHYEHAPELYEVKTSQINGSDAPLTISMAPGGGFACVLKTLEE
jgi:alpha-glucosidase